MQSEIENHTTDVLTQTLSDFILNEGYRVMSARCGGKNKDTEIVVLTKEHDLSKKNYEIRVLFKRHEEIELESADYYGYGIHQMTIAYTDTDATDHGYLFLDTMYHESKKTILSETYEYNDKFFVSKTELINYLKNEDKPQLWRKNANIRKYIG